MFDKAAYLQHRERFHIREATPEELASMTELQRWHYNASAFKPFGEHYEYFRHEGKPVKPLHIINGKIETFLPNNVGVQGRLCPHNFQYLESLTEK